MKFKMNNVEYTVKEVSQQSYESDNILLIFDNKAELLKYKRSKKYMCPNEILKTIDELCEINTLTGIRYKQYYFV